MNVLRAACSDVVYQGDSVLLQVELADGGRSVAARHRPGGAALAPWPASRDAGRRSCWAAPEDTACWPTTRRHDRSRDR